jgi:MYXO-CTERM domain-containing protein
MGNPWARGAVVAGVAALAALVVDRDARACGAEVYEATIVIPAEGDPAMPRDGVLVAGLHALYGVEPSVVLRTIDGTEIPIDVELQIDDQGSDGLVIARPMVELDASASYVWDVDGWQRPFHTTTALDAGPPTFEGLEILAIAEHEVPGHCGERDHAIDHDVRVAGTSEPIATFAKRLFDGRWNGLEIEAGDQILLRNQSPQGEMCFEISIVDQAGHLVAVGEDCVPVAHGEPDPADEGDGSTSQADQALDDEALDARGCTCGSERGSDAATLAMSGLLLVALRRRRVCNTRFSA